MYVQNIFYRCTLFPRLIFVIIRKYPFLTFTNLVPRKIWQWLSLSQTFHLISLKMCGEKEETPICQVDLNEDEVFNKEIVAIFLLGRLYSGDNHRVSAHFVSQGVLTNCGESQWPYYRIMTNAAQVFLSSSKPGRVRVTGWLAWPLCWVFPRLSLYSTLLVLFYKGCLVLLESHANTITIHVLKTHLLQFGFKAVCQGNCLLGP